MASNAGPSLREAGNVPIFGRTPPEHLVYSVPYVKEVLIADGLGLQSLPIRPAKRRMTDVVERIQHYDSLFVDLSYQLAASGQRSPGVIKPLCPHDAGHLSEVQNDLLRGYQSACRLPVFLLSVQADSHLQPQHAAQCWLGLREYDQVTVANVLCNFAAKLAD